MSNSATISVDYKDVWNSVTDVATLLATNATYNMGGRAFVVPRGLDPMALTWPGGQPSVLEQGYVWTSTCSNWGMCSESRLRVGCVWSPGGRYGGRGRYLHDAYLFAVVSSTGLGQSFSATGSFSSTPVTVGSSEIAQLQATINVEHHFLGMHHGSHQFDFTIQGDGAGWLRVS